MIKSLEFIGTCITTVDDLDFWDATEMAQCIEDSTPMDVSELVDLLGNKELAAKIKANKENFEAGSNHSIAWIYDIDEDLHYFYYMHGLSEHIKTFVEFNESLYLNEGERIQNGILLIYAKKESAPDKRKVYAVHVKNVVDNGKGFRMAFINTALDVYRIYFDGKIFKAGKVAMKETPSSVALHWNKTPMHEKTLQYDNVNTMLNKMKDDLINLEGADWNV